PYAFQAVYLGHLGHYRCDSCGQRRPDPALTAAEVRLDGVRGSRFQLRTDAGTIEVQLGLPGLYNVYNALAAASLARALELPLQSISEGLARATAVFGRAETVTLSLSAG